MKWKWWILGMIFWLIAVVPVQDIDYRMVFETEYITDAIYIAIGLILIVYSIGKGE